MIVKKNLRTKFYRKIYIITAQSTITIIYRHLRCVHIIQTMKKVQITFQKVTNFIFYFVCNHTLLPLELTLRILFNNWLDIYQI